MPARRPVMKAARSAGIGGDHAADRRRRLGWIRTEELTRAGGSFLQLGQADRGSANGPSGLNLQLAEPAEREHPPTLRNARAGKPGARACDGQGNVLANAVPDDVLNISDRLGNDDAVGGSFVTGGVFEKRGDVYTRGVQSVLLRPKRDEVDLLTAELWEMGTIGIIEEGDCLRAFFADAVDTSSLSYVVEVREETEAGSYDVSHEDWTPLFVGNRFFLAPSWIADPTPEGRLRLTVDSPTAFGTGRHETTQLALEYLEEAIGAGEVVVDIGCGSGILSAAARMLGAKTVVGCDIDELAVRAAITDFGIPAFMGSADGIRSGVADILLVNISARVIDVLAPELKRIAKAEARILLSGFIRGREPECFAPEERRERGDWLCSMGTRNSIRAPEVSPGTIIRHPAQWW